MSDRNLRFTEAWFRLLAEAARGTREAQDTIRALAEQAPTPEALRRRIAEFLPSGIVPPPEQLGEWAEGFWVATGVVPRSRYLELLERYEALRARLEEAEVTIQKHRKLLAERGRESDAERVLDAWASAVGETLRAQTEWMRSWIPRPPEWDEEGREPREKTTGSSRGKPPAKNGPKKK